MPKPQITRSSEFFNLIRKELDLSYEANEAAQLSKVLFEHFAGIGIKEMIIDPDSLIDNKIIMEINEAVARLLKHEPIQYITGIAHFCSYEFHVTPEVLIPRPETEELLHWILDDHVGRHNVRIADIGTGSACIAISLSLILPDARVYAYDVSETALKIAAQNNAALSAEVVFQKIDFLNPGEWPDEKFDVVVSNPPYIPFKNKAVLPPGVTGYEPAKALFVPDKDPLVFYRALASFASSHLNKNGSLYVEVHEHYADEVVVLFNNSGIQNVELHLDLNGKKRMVKGSI